MGYDNFHKLVDLWRKLQEAEFSPIVAVTGGRGTGKTSFSIQGSRFYLKKYMGEDYFSVRKYIAYDNEEVMTKYYTHEEYLPLIADEAARFAMGEDWNKAINKELKKTTAQIRPRRLLFFMNIPSFRWLDSKYREEMVNMWVWIPTRGYAVIFRPDTNPGVQDRWHLNELKEYKHRIDEFTPIDKISNMVGKHKCFSEIVQFPPVPEDVYAEYFEYRQQRTFSDNAGSYVDQREMAKIMTFNLKRNWNKMIAAVTKSRFEKPTYRIMADHLFKDPMSQKPLVQYTTVRNWAMEIGEKVSPEIAAQLQDANDTDKQEGQGEIGEADA